MQLRPTFELPEMQLLIARAWLRITGLLRGVNSIISIQTGLLMVLASNGIDSRCQGPPPFAGDAVAFNTRASTANFLTFYHRHSSTSRASLGDPIGMLGGHEL